MGVEVSLADTPCVGCAPRDMGGVGGLGRGGPGWAAGWGGVGKCLDLPCGHALCGACGKRKVREVGGVGGAGRGAVGWNGVGWGGGVSTCRADTSCMGRAPKAR